MGGVDKNLSLSIKHQQQGEISQSQCQSQSNPAFESVILELTSSSSLRTWSYSSPFTGSPTGFHPKCRRHGTIQVIILELASTWGRTRISHHSALWIITASLTSSLSHDPQELILAYETVCHLQTTHYSRTVEGIKWNFQSSEVLTMHWGKNSTRRGRWKC